MSRYNLSEAGNNSSIAIILIPIFAILAIVGVLAAYCKSHHQRRNSNRNPGMSATASRKEQETSKAGDGQQQLAEREPLSTQEAGAEQQLDSDNGARAIADDNNSRQPESNERSELPPTSDTFSDTRSSRSGTISGARPSTSMEESEHSDLKEVITEGSQRSQSLANVSQGSPRTSIQNLERMNARSRPSLSSISSQVVGCLRNSCS